MSAYPSQADLVSTLKSFFEDLPNSDKRKVVYPIIEVPGTNGIAMRGSTVLTLVEAFKKNKRSNHSGMGATVWVSVAYCVAELLPYRFTSDPNLGGFTVEVLPPDWFEKRT